jgi:hypothetical protein
MDNLYTNKNISRIEIVKEIEKVKIATSLKNGSDPIIYRSWIPGYIFGDIDVFYIYMFYDNNTFVIDFDKKKLILHDFWLHPTNAPKELLDYFASVFKMNRSKYTANYVCNNTGILPYLSYTKAYGKFFFIFYDYVEAEERSIEQNTILIDSIFEVKLDNDDFLKLIPNWRKS